MIQRVACLVWFDELSFSQREREREERTVVTLTLLVELGLLGLAAGSLTTVAGQGGGLLLLLACSTLAGPHEALAITAPALLLGNLHRAVWLRAHINKSIALRMIV